jgi:trk system potassium uptake protein TrkA
MLVRMKMKVSVIEVKKDKARRLADALPGATIIEGDGTDQELLESEGLSDTHAFITLSDRDEENLMAGFYAAQRGVKKVIVKSSRDTYSAIMHNMGLDSIISTKSVACNDILRVVRSRSSRSTASVERVYRLMEGQAEALEFIVENEAAYTGIPLKDLRLKKNILIGGILRDRKAIIPAGDDMILPGDRVVVIASKHRLNALADILL